MAIGQHRTYFAVVLIENIGEGVSYAAPATRQVYDWYRKSDLADDTGGG